MDLVVMGLEATYVMNRKQEVINYFFPVEGI